MRDDRPWHRVLYVAALAGMVAAVAVIISRPLEWTMPVYADLAGRLRYVPVPTSFEPLGYPWLIGLFPGGSFTASVKGLHLLCYTMLAVLVVRVAQRRTALYPMLVLSSSAWILFNPYVLVNLVRLNDNNVNVLAIFGLFALVQSRSEPDGGWHPLHAAIAGCLLGGLALVRPNVLSLVPALLFAFWRGGRDIPTKHTDLVRLSAFAAIAIAATYACFSLIISGRPAFWPGNGPYNLFAGNNPAALRAVLSDYNAEPSLSEGLAWCGVHEAPLDVEPARYLECTRRFVVERPAAVFELAAVKFYNLMFRPNLRLADSAGEAIGQSLLVALPLFWWAATGLSLVRQQRLLDPLATVFVLMYALPFVLTNSDPRFRLPLDAVYALSLSSPATMALFRDAIWRRGEASRMA